MLSNNYQFAPPIKTVDGLLAVPIDIQNINASLVFDGANSSGQGDATVEFITGPQDGNSIFDLRQTITEAWLDGATIALSNIAPHDFGGGVDAQLRIIESLLTAETTHTLRTRYALGLPQASNAGSYQPAISWSSGPRLVFNFGFTDLGPGRYLEAWVPANLIYDQFELNLDIQLINTTVPHSVITNGAVTTIDTNHWQINFPSTISALSPLLEIRATDTVTSASDTVTLPVSGSTVTIEAWKLNSSDVDLSAQINNIKTHLTNNENNVGAYVHGNRFVAFFHVGGMEYDGGTTTDIGPLRHETYHSWWGRGIKPASHVDGWWDEGWTKYHDYGGSTAVPFDFTNAPIELSQRNPWKRNTPSNSYSDGRRFFEGLASLLGVGNLDNYMDEIYEEFKGRPINTETIEAILLSRSGQEQVVDAFHRFVYGFSDTFPDLWLKDDTAHTGAHNWTGAFWDSPDLWIRNRDDGGTTHQNPEYGQDNWFYARVRNRSGTQTAKHFMMAFNVKSFAGVEFVYPGDFFPCTNAVAGFELGPNDSTIVKARWQRHLVPPPGAHPCLLGTVIARNDHPATGLHVWEHNNICQKNLTVVDLFPGDWIVIPFVFANLTREYLPFYALEVRRPRDLIFIDTQLLHTNPDVFNRRPLTSAGIKKQLQSAANSPVSQTLLDCGGDTQISERNTLPWTSSNPNAAVAEQFADAQPTAFRRGKISHISVAVPREVPLYLGWRIEVPKDAKPGTILRLDLVKRTWCRGKVLGGITAEIHVKGTDKKTV